MSAPAPPPAQAEPFVGPRAFQTADAWRFFGREREAADLADIVTASRIVLLYSPSGAGKSSLLNAAVIPQFQERFRVLPVISVGMAPGPSADGTAVNRYLRSALLSLENGLCEAERTPASELAGVGFAGYLDRLRERAGDDRPELLVFDQFEEIFSIDPFDLDAKTAFFEQVGEALRDRQRWAIFSMREEYDAQLDPYRRFVPTGLATRFRLDLLSTDAAKEAIWRPTSGLPVKITVDAADRIVSDLSQIKTEQGGTVVTRQGPYVDPVQLQVICLRLWEHRAPGATEITEDDIERTGTNVDTALAEYYDETVAWVSAETGVAERSIRAWIGDQLITRHGVRNRVVREPGETRGLDDRVIDLLIARYLLRPVPGDATWVELAHDRLVLPVRQSNERWFRDNLSVLQRHAEAWEKGGRRADLLLPPGLLDEARQWEEENRDQVTPAERDLLLASEAAADAARARMWRRLAPAALGLIVFLGVLAGWAMWERAQKGHEADAARDARATAEAQAIVSRTQALAAQAPDQHDVGDDERGALLALQAYTLDANGGHTARGPVDEALRAVLARPNFSVVLRSGERVVAAAFSADGSRLATASTTVDADGNAAVTIRLWNLMDAAADPTVLRGPADHVTVLAFSPDGTRLAAGGSDTMYLLDTASGQPASKVPSIKGNVTALAFSPDSARLAVLGSVPLQPTSTLQVWDVKSGARMWEPVGIGRADTVIAFTADGASLAASTGDEIQFVDADSGQLLAETLPSRAGVTAMAFSGDGRKVAVANGSNGAIRLWTSADEAESFELRGGASSVTALAFSGDSRTLAAGHSDGTVQLWDTSRPGDDPLVLRGHGGGVRAVVFSADDSRLATASEDKTARLWDLGPAAAGSGVVVSGGAGGRGSTAGALVFADDKTLRLAAVDSDGGVLSRSLSGPDTEAPLRVPGRGGGVTALAISPEESLLATGGRDGTVQLWGPEGTPLPGPTMPPGTRASVSALAFSEDGSKLAIGSTDGTVRVWRRAAQGWDEVPRGPRVAVTALVFLPDGSLLSGGADGIVRAWDPSRPDAGWRDALDNGNGIAALALDRGGATLAIGDDDGTVRLLPVAQLDADPVVLRGALGRSVTALTFSPDGAILFTAHADGSVRSWIARTDILAGMVCQKVRRNLTMEEWTRFIGPQVDYQRTCDELPPGEGAPGAGTPVAAAPRGAGTS